MGVVSFSVPGVYQQPAPRQADFPRIRTDVAGFVGVAGPNGLYQATRCDDWRDFVEAFLRDPLGNLVSPPPGSRLADAVRAYFTNGGARCWVVNIAETIPDFGDDNGRNALMTDMLGIPRSNGPRDPKNGELLPTGLELLLKQDEVAIAVLPELDATVAVEQARTARLPPVAEEGSFFDCSQRPPSGGIPPSLLPPLLVQERQLWDYNNPAQRLELLGAQQYFMQRCQRDAWRVFGIIGTPPALTQQQVLKWRNDVGVFEAGAIYWPWLYFQAVPGQPVMLRSPVGHVAGVYARRDLSRGPQSPPANETLIGVVGLQTAVDDRINGTLYDAGINPLRAFPAIGVQVWGARTLQWTDPSSLNDPDKDFVFVNIRRCLSAIERTCERLGQAVVFEPNLPMLRISLIMRITGYLLDVFRTGALSGPTPQTSFFVKCDNGNNPPDVVAEGKLICDVGVAIAAPAEFIVFRLGRSEGAVEIEEGA